MSALPASESELMTEADYLAFEDASETKHEFVDGHVYDWPGYEYDAQGLAGASRAHNRLQTRLVRFTRKAHFPFFRTIEEFDFHRQPVLRKSHLGSYLEPDFVREGRSLIRLAKCQQARCSSGCSLFNGRTVL